METNSASITKQNPEEVIFGITLYLWNCLKRLEKNTVKSFLCPADKLYMFMFDYFPKLSVE